MDVQVNRKTVLVSAAVLAILAGVTAALWPAPEPGRTDGIPQPGPADTPVRVQPAGAASSRTSPELASVGAATAFYAVDYQNYDGWLAGLKAMSTSDGYAILQRSIAPAVWPQIQKAQTVTPASAVKAIDGGLLLEGVSPIGGPWQIRSVSVTIDPAHLWPTMKASSFTTLMMLARPDGDWRFVSFVTQDQLDALKGEQKP